MEKCWGNWKKKSTIYKNMQFIGMHKRQWSLNSDLFFGGLESRTVLITSYHFIPCESFIARRHLAQKSVFRGNLCCISQSSHAQKTGQLYARWFKPWPFYPLIGGHLTLERITYCTHLKKVTSRIARCSSGWWFQIFFIFTPIWGRFPIWLIFFEGVETTN